MTNDPLSDIVRSLDLIGGVFLEANFSAPWAIKSQVTNEDCKPFMDLPKQVIAYHVVTQGEALVSLGNQFQYRAKAGEVVLLPDNSLHVLASSHAAKPTQADDLVLPPDQSGLSRIRFGGGGDPTRILCGFLACGTLPKAIIQMLPKVLIIRLEDIAALQWIEASITKAVRELQLGRVGSKNVMSKLAELLLIEALREHLEKHPVGHGWLSGMAHPQIAKALARVHTQLEDPPDVTELAALAGMSRSSFVDHFTKTVGLAPGKYVLEHRMSAAKLLLRETQLTLGTVAQHVGYDATEAFSRAFKRETGMPPAEWRHHIHNAP